MRKLCPRYNEELLIEVKSGRQKLTSSVIKNVARKARYHNAKPVIRKSPRTTITSGARELARKYGVRIRNYK